jgi:hypothetical protein
MFLSRKHPGSSFLLIVDQIASTRGFVRSHVRPYGSHPGVWPDRTGTVQTVALLAKAMTTGTLATFLPRNGATHRTAVIVVVNTMSWRFSGLSQGVKRRYSRQCGLHGGRPQTTSGVSGSWQANAFARDRFRSTRPPLRLAPHVCRQWVASQACSSGRLSPMPRRSPPRSCARRCPARRRHPA